MTDKQEANRISFPIPDDKAIEMADWRREGYSVGAIALAFGWPVASVENLLAGRTKQSRRLFGGSVRSVMTTKRSG